MGEFYGFAMDFDEYQAGLGRMTSFDCGNEGSLAGIASKFSGSAIV